MAEKIWFLERILFLLAIFLGIILLIVVPSIIGIDYIRILGITGNAVQNEPQETLLDGLQKTMNFSFENSSGYSYENVSFNNSVELKKNVVIFEFQEINATEQEIKKAIYKDKDETDKINALDDKNLKVEDSDLLYLEFNGQLENDDTLSLSILGPSEANLTIELCSVPCEILQGKIEFNGTSELKQYNISIQSLNNPSKNFTINVSSDIKKSFISVDYAKAFQIREFTRQVIQEIYAENGFIETGFVEDDIDKWLTFNKQDIVNESEGQKIDYYYFDDEWIFMNFSGDEFNLSELNINRTKFRAELFSTDNLNCDSSPVLISVSINYLVKNETNETQSNETIPEIVPGNSETVSPGGGGGGGWSTTKNQEQIVEQESQNQSLTANNEIPTERILEKSQNVEKKEIPGLNMLNLSLIALFVFIPLSLAIYFTEKRKNIKTKKTRVKHMNTKLVFLSIIVVSMFLIGGFITGKVIQENTKVYISDDIIKTLNNEYNSNINEKVVCLTGTKDLFNYHINGYYLPEIKNSNAEQVEYEACGSDSLHKDVIATWHNHINGACVLSDSDLFSFGGDYFSYGVKLQIVQCDVDKLGIFDKNTIYKQGTLSEEDGLAYLTE